jgi:hypothetical protein
MTASLANAGWLEREDDKLDEAKKARSAGKTRVQLDLSPRAVERLNDLKDKTEAASYAEVIKNALKLYDGIISEIESGNEFLTRDKNGTMVPFRMFL